MELKPGGKYVGSCGKRDNSDCITDAGLTHSGSATVKEEVLGSGYIFGC